jgi:serine/threonine protein kinase
MLHVTRILKVLHGDLAARNVLLADDGVAKVADFGMARKMYYEGNYKQSGQVNLIELNYLYASSCFTIWLILF